MCQLLALSSSFITINCIRYNRGGRLIHSNQKVDLQHLPLSMQILACIAVFGIALHIVLYRYFFPLLFSFSNQVGALFPNHRGQPQRCLFWIIATNLLKRKCQGSSSLLPSTSSRWLLPFCTEDACRMQGEGQSVYQPMQQFLSVICIMRQNSWLCNTLQ